MELLIGATTPNSTAISSWKYRTDDEAGTVGVLFVTFTNGTTYAYPNCHATMALAMAGQASVGRYFAHTVKPHFGENFVKVAETANA
jgi:hypothetical protein